MQDNKFSQLLKSIECPKKRKELYELRDKLSKAERRQDRKKK